MQLQIALRIGLLAWIGIISSAFVKAQNAIEPETVYVEGGKFQKGLEREQLENGDSIPSFYMGKFEVTQAQWQELMGNNPSVFNNCAQCPVEMVTMYDAQAYIARLNERTGKNYRLPTRAEWEYAARGGKESKNYIFSGSNTMGDVAWYAENSKYKSHPVGNKQPNELGIFDMSGNVAEWCSDWEDVAGQWYQSYQSALDYKGPKPLLIRNRVVMGCSMFGSPDHCNVAEIRLINPNDFSAEYGFRVVYSTHQH